MAPPVNSSVQQLLQQSLQSVGVIQRTLQLKVQWLRQHRSTDSLQQMQTDAIGDLYDAVVEIAKQLSSMSDLLPLIVPDTSGARAAAEAAAAAAAIKRLTTSPGPFKK